MGQTGGRSVQGPEREPAGGRGVPTGAAYCSFSRSHFLSIPPSFCGAKAGRGEAGDKAVKPGRRASTWHLSGGGRSKVRLVTYLVYLHRVIMAAAAGLGGRRAGRGAFLARPLRGWHVQGRCDDFSWSLASRCRSDVPVMKVERRPRRTSSRLFGFGCKA